MYTYSIIQRILPNTGSTILFGLLPLQGRSCVSWYCPIYSDTLHWWDITPIFDPLLIWTLLPNLTFYLILLGFHRTFATDAACQQRTLTPPDTWSCPTLGLACVLMSRPTSPELVLFPDFWVSNIPWYFCFALKFIFYVLNIFFYV